MSIIDPSACGFAKVAVYSIITGPVLKKNVGEKPVEYKSRMYKRNFQTFNTIFQGNEKFAVQYKQFTTNFNKIKDNIALLGKNNKIHKKDVIEIFSTEGWKNLNPAQKIQHSLHNCKGCFNNELYRLNLNKFPIKSKAGKKKADTSGLTSKENPVLIDTTKKILNDMNQQYRNVFGTSFLAAQKVVTAESSLCSDEILTFQPISSTPKVKTRDIELKGMRKMKQDMEIQLAETAVERAYGVTLSLSSRQKLRMATSFETTEIAKKRTKNDIEDIKNGVKRKRDHVGKIDSYSWDFEECYNEVTNYPDGHIINYSDLARKFNLKSEHGILPKNGGQIVKEILSNKGLDLFRFDSLKKRSRGIVRRKKRRVDSSCISFPTDVTNVKVNNMLKEKIQNGIYSIGEIVVPRMFECLKFKDGKIKTEHITVSGRKEQLEMIRRSLIKKHQLLMRIFPDSHYDSMTEEALSRELARIGEHSNCGHLSFSNKVQYLKSLQRHQNLTFWHDASTISNHSHLLMMTNYLYDKAIHFSDAEYYERYGEKLSVQNEIEKPELYLLARCPSTDEQLAYSDTRMEDIKQLAYPIETENGIEMYDIMRFFKGDGPSAEFEAGQQKGGDYFCWACAVKGVRTSDITHVYNLPYISFKERIENVLTSIRSQNATKSGTTKLYSNLSVDAIRQELQEREVKYRVTDSKENVTKLLKEEMAGMQRVPALLYDVNNPSAPLEQHFLHRYDILPCEPLHDITGHIKNLYVELPSHLSKYEKIIFNQAVESAFEGKDCKRGSDYRLSLIKLCSVLKGKIPKIQYEILTTLAEIQQIIYSHDISRTNRAILRLHNVTFCHALLLNKLVDAGINVLTRRKLFGKYFHAITSHVAHQYRIISGRSSYTEQEERTFNFLKTTSSNTSNHDPNNVILNAMIRMQAKMKFNENQLPHQRYENQIKKLFENQNLKYNNTKFSFDWIKSHPYLYQSHLERIADFLLIRHIWQETDDGVVFHDCIDVIGGQKVVHHFRSHTMKTEFDHVKKCWDVLCQTEKHLLPAEKIKIEKDGLVEIMHLSSLKHFENIAENNSTLSQQLANSTIDFDIIKPVETSTPTSLITQNQCVILKDITTTVENEIQLTKESSSYDVTSGNDILECEYQVPDTIISLRNISTSEMNAPLAEDKSVKSSITSKTGRALFDVLGGIDEVYNYDRLRVQYKTKQSKSALDKLKDVRALLEIKLVSSYKRCKDDMKRLEMKALNDNEMLNIVPSSKYEKSKYDKVVHKLRCHKVLKNEFEF